MWRIVSAVLALAAAGIAYFFMRMYQVRKEMIGLPQPPRGSWLIGHLQIAAECQKHFPPDLHPHAFAHYMRKKYDLGKFFYVDWWPLGPRWLFIADPEISSQYITTAQSLPKSPLETGYLNKFLGNNNLVGLEGQHWKSLRSMFNPGFSGAHLMTLVPYIVDASLVFCDVLRRRAETDELTQLEEEATNLTIDIIGKVVLDSDLNAQKGVHPIVKTFRHQVALMPPADTINPFQGIDLLRPLKLWLNSRKLDRLIGEELDSKFAARSAEPQTNGSAEKPSTKKERKRSVVDLAIDTYQKDLKASAIPDSSSGKMPKSMRQDIIDSMKTFIFAGHDTTASTIAYTFYLLHLYPAKHARVVAELNDLLPADPKAAADVIKNDPYIINKLDYTTAIIKEVLRLFPPASTLRYQPPSADPTQQLHLSDADAADPAKRYPLNGFEVWPIAAMIMRNEAFFPQAVDFIPERFLPAETPFPDALLFTPRGKDAWRPFEKGPRNCIGQELAMIETKIILAMSLRGFDFVAEFDGKKVDSIVAVESVLELGTGAERMTIEGHPCYQILRGSAKPRAGMPGRVSLRS